MSLFGGTSTASKPLFGGPATTTASSGGLFGSTAPSTTGTAGGLFGSTATTASTGGLFGSTNTATSVPATGGLFGTTTTAAAPVATGGLFGSTAPATTSTPLFGTTSAAPAATSLFGAATTASTTGGLFGAAKPATGGLFGSSATTTAPATATTGSLFGTTTTAPAPLNLGLGGVQQQKVATSTSGTTTTTLTEKEASKDGEIAGAAQIREMLPLIEERLKKNREIIEEVENNYIDNSPSVDEMIDKTRGWINEARRSVRDGNDMSIYIAKLITEDKAFLETAKRLQEASTTSNQTTLSNKIKSHLFELTDNYDKQVAQMQQRVDGIRTKFERFINGEPVLSMEELDDLFRRCDASYANAQYRIHDTGREIEALKNMLIEQGYTHLRKSYPSYATTATTSNNEGAEFFPSQSSLAIIGSSLRAPATTAPAAGGLTLGTGTSLFGSNTGGTSLFGSTTAPKPTFSGGSLFGNLSSTPATSTATAAAAPTTTTSSLFPSFGSKPTTTFASTVSNNSSGLLFSMKK